MITAYVSSVAALIFIIEGLEAIFGEDNKY